MIILLMCGLTSASDIIMNYEDYRGHENFWYQTPDVVLCQEQTLFTKKEVEDVIKNIWKEEIGSITVRERCDYNHERGKIKILDGKHLRSYELGNTRLIMDEVVRNGKHVERYKSSVVQLDTTEGKDIRLLVHELGHAFGFHHYDASIDVMNAKPRY